MKTLRLYLDTSVIGGYFDPEFAEPTRRLFDGFRAGRSVVVVSNIVMAELAGAPPQVRELVTASSEFVVEVVTEDEESITLAGDYIAAEVVSGNFYNDCRHVALAAVTRADLLVSWNFRHIVRFDSIRAYNAVNLVKGYGMLDIRSPLEVFPDED